ncbi:MAG: site-2 protease family protein [Candidatus Bathyarchaeia archaeon]
MYDLAVMATLYFVVMAALYLLSKSFSWERRGVTVGPLYLIFKTSRFNQKLNSISSRWRRLWRILGNIGVALALGQMVYIIYFMFQNLLNLAYRSPEAAGMVLLLPGLTVSLETLPYIIVALAVVLLTHELAHAIAGLTDGVHLKSAGVFLAFIIPGGFVELDEKQLERSRLSTKLRVYSAGSSANLATWMFVTLLFINFTSTITPFYNGPSGILVSGIISGGGASDAGLAKWDVIYSINDQPIRSVDELSRFMSGVQPGTVLSLRTDKGQVEVVTKPHPQDPARALIGIYPFNYYAPKHFLPKELPYHLYYSEYWMSVLLVWIAIFNMLPLYPLDGDRILHSIVNSRSKGAAKTVRIITSVIFTSIVGLNLAMSLTNFGLIRV